MKINAYICYNVRGYHSTISLSPINNGFAPDKIALDLPDEFEYCEAANGFSSPWIEHKASGAHCEFAHRAPGEPPMLVWRETCNGKQHPMRKLLKVMDE